jgi:L-ascorbate metabolism protein UlaG (beta-lactamase superfamily)
VTFIECGAYDVQWADIHMQPEETLLAHLDLQGGWLVPIHNGTFDLALHPWTEPFERLYALAEAKSVPLATPVMGERLSLTEPQAGRLWWREALCAFPEKAHSKFSIP